LARIASAILGDVALPPGPTAPPWSQTAQILLRPEPFLEGARRRYGNVFTVRTAVFGAFVVVADPALVRDVFTASPDRLRAGESNAPLSPLVGTGSVLVLDGPEHLRHRRLLLPSFHGEHLRAAAALIERATLRELEDWPARRPFSLLEPMRRITLEVIVRVVFGVREAARHEELSARLRTVIEPLGGRVRAILGALAGGAPGTTAGPDAERFAARRAAVDELIYAEIERRRTVPRLEERDDVLSLLLLARDEEGEGLSDSEIRDELVTLLLAGHETTATALAWAFERLLRHPQALARAREEALAGGHEYLDAVAKEALRVRPVLPNVGRVLADEWELAGHVLPKGTAVLPSIALMHRRDEVFPDAEAFEPERFLGPDAPGGYEWIPFGGGTRRCLGASFALLEMRIVLATVLSRLDLRTVEDRPEAVVRRGITLTPEHGARVRLAA
jgi:cytochrome P450 family 135